MTGVHPRFPAAVGNRRGVSAGKPFPGEEGYVGRSNHVVATRVEWPDAIGIYHKNMREGLDQKSTSIALRQARACRTAASPWRLTIHHWEMTAARTVAARCSKAGLWLALAACIVAVTGCGSSEVAQVPPPSAKAQKRSPTVAVPPMLREVSDELGLDFIHIIGNTGTYFFPEIMIGGGALLDYDQDGDLDIYLVNGNYRYVGQEGPTPTPATNRLFRQESDGRFVEVTAESGLDDDEYGMGVAVGDINNDGFPDVYVTNYGPDHLYLNQGDGTFRNITKEAGIENLRWSASACFVDYDRDGWLDLYVTNYVDYFPSVTCKARDGRPDYCSPSAFEGTYDVLFHNTTKQRADGQGLVTFEDVSASSGIARRRGSGLGIAVADVNDDTWPDLFVANDGNANFLWVNAHDGTFRDEAIMQGSAYDSHGRSQANMGIAVDDINGDGKQDFFITHLAGESNAMFMADETSGFQEASVDRGLGVASFQFTGFGTAFADLEHDGDLDLVLVNGRVTLPRSKPNYPGLREVEGMTQFWRPFAEPNLMFLNDGQGHFTPISSPQDDFLSVLGVSRALCAGDIDNDGDVDFLVVNAQGRAELYKNEAEKKGNWLMVRAVEPAFGGRDAYGAVISLKTASRTWQRAVRAAASYCSSHDPRVHFGLGEVADVESIEVLWPDGNRERFPGCRTNQQLTLRHGDGQQP